MLKKNPLMHALVLSIFSSALATFSSPSFCEQKVTQENSYINVTLGDDRLQRLVTFAIPSRYHPETHGNFFRIVVDYPSMKPTTGPRSGKLDEGSLDIVVNPYPRNGTIADKVIDGTYGAKKTGAEEGYDIYRQPMGSSPPVKTFAYKDNNGNNVIIEDPGTWSIRYQLTRGEKPSYLIRCAFSKRLNANFREIDVATSKLISSMFVR